MTDHILVFYGSYRSDRMGIRLAHFVVGGLRSRGDDVELIDAREVGLPMLDRMYKEYPKGQKPAALEDWQEKIRSADGFVFVTGEYNWGNPAGAEKTSPIISWRNGFGVPPRLRAIPPGACPARARRPPGTARSPKWAWW